MGKNLQQATALDQTKVQSYPHVCDMKHFRGKKHEDLKIFRKDDDKAYAYQWNMIENKWNEVGEVLAEQGGGQESSVQKGKEYYAGDGMFPAGLYDQLIPVALEDGMPQLKLPYNEGDNVMQIAQRFLTFHNLPMAHMDQIRNHIEKNIEQNKPQPLIRPTNNTAPSNQQEYQPSKPAEAPTKVETKKFPLRQTKYWTDMNIEGMSKKLKETNDRMFDAQDARALHSGEWAHFNSLITKLRDPLLYANPITAFREAELEAFKKTYKWDTKDFVAIMDMLRVMLNHNSSQALLGGADCGKGLMILLNSKLDSKPISNVFYKVIANLCQHVAGVHAIFSSTDVITEAFEKIDYSDAKHITSLACFAMNLAVSLEMTNNKKDPFVITTAKMAGKLAASSAILNLDVLRVAAAIGNIVCWNPAFIPELKDHAQIVYKKLNDNTDPEIKLIAADFKNMFGL